MEPIPEAIVEKTWQEVAGFSPEKAKKELMKISNSQPDLLALVTEWSEEMGQEVRELAIFMFVVVYRMFQQAHRRIKKISSKEVIECYQHNKTLMERLGGADETFVDRIVSVQTSKQLYVVNYVVDALMEEDEGEDALVFTEEEKGSLFLILKTVIDALDQKGIG